jgi:hypothetical protein
MVLGYPFMDYFLIYITLCCKINQLEIQLQYKYYNIELRIRHIVSVSDGVIHFDSKEVRTLKPIIQ